MRWRRPRARSIGFPVRPGGAFSAPLRPRGLDELGEQADSHARLDERLDTRAETVAIMSFRRLARRQPADELADRPE